MRVELFILLLVPVASAKCGVEYVKKTGSSNSGISRASFCNDVEMFEMCNRAQLRVDQFADLVMQYMLTNDIKAAYLDFNSLEGECHQSITCYHDFSNFDDKNCAIDSCREELYCENTDLYNACVKINNNFKVFTTLLNSSELFNNIMPFAPNIQCTRSNTVGPITEGAVASDASTLQYSFVMIVSCLLIFTIIA